MKAQVKTSLIASLCVFASCSAVACGDPEDDGLGYGQPATGGEATDDIDPEFMDGTGGVPDAGSGGSSSSGGAEATGGAVSGSGGTDGGDECAQLTSDRDTARALVQACDPDGVDQCQEFVPGVCDCLIRANDSESLAAQNFTELANAYSSACLEFCSPCTESSRGVCVATDNGGRCE